MKLLLIGTARQPTMNVGSNGLGRHTYDFISKFKEKSHINITTLLHKDSKLEWDDIRQLSYYDEVNDLQNIINHIEQERYDVIIDFSHYHILSNVTGDIYPIINFIHDEECQYMPPNCMVANWWQQKKYTNARIFRTGIDITKYPLYKDKKDYYSFCGKIEPRKGYDVANYVTQLSGIKTIFAGPNVDGNAETLPNWVGEIKGHNLFCEHVGNSIALFYPSRSEAGGLAILEAMALGTPTLTIAGSGTQCNVEHGITGYVANSTNELLEYVKLVKDLDITKIRQVCEEKHDFNKNFEVIYDQILKFINGDRW